MKKYDLVISDSPEELIETVNAAILQGYDPLGGMASIQGKCVQTIVLN